VAGALLYLVRLLLMQERFVEAERVARECLTMNEGMRPDDWATFHSRSLLGGSLLGQEKYAEAEPLLVSGYEGMQQREDKISEVSKPRLKEALQRLVQLYQRTGRPEKASELKATLSEVYRKRVERLRQEARGDDPRAINRLAWFLATCPEAAIRDGAEAVRLAEKAVAASNRKVPIYLDTLAAAYAEAGQFDKAVAVQKETIAISTSNQARQWYASRLKLYEAKTPYRERE
jgi:tetratricopeptide (TPR) repeat protein